MKDAKGHGSNGRGGSRIAKVVAVRYMNEPGSFRRRAAVDHVDAQGRHGTTSGYEDNLHMGQLITRGLREGATVSGGTPAMGHKIDSGTVGMSNDQIAARALASGPKSDPVPVHDSMSWPKERPIRNVPSLDKYKG